jgi:hypothetical protein
MRVKAS